MPFKSTNFDINIHAFEDYIPCSDSSLSKKNNFPIQYDNKEHATNLIAVYYTDEYWRAVFFFVCLFLFVLFL